MPAAQYARTHATTRKNAKRTYRDILYEVKDQVAWITINRPRVLNCFREQSLDEMIDALKSTREDPSIVCAVVTGSGDKSFSAGATMYCIKTAASEDPPPSAVKSGRPSKFRWT